MTKLIELWKTGCSDCEEIKPILADLIREGYDFDQYNIVDAEGQKVIKEYQKEIIEFSKSKGYDPENLYTPTLINPNTREVLFYPEKPPTKEEVVRLAS